MSINHKFKIELCYIIALYQKAIIELEKVPNGNSFQAWRILEEMDLDLGICHFLRFHPYPFEDNSEWVDITEYWKGFKPINKAYKDYWDYPPAFYFDSNSVPLIIGALEVRLDILTHEYYSRYD